MSVKAILTAAGSGARFRKLSDNKTGLPKQFLSLNGKPVFLFSLLTFQKCKTIDEIIIISSQKHFDFIHNIAVKNKISKLTHLVEGGKTRFESVRNGFNSITARKDDIILIHDAARPNITLKFINQLIADFKKCGGLVPGLKVSETVKRAKNSYVKETVDRSELWTIQTPQLFKFGVLQSSYKRNNKNNWTDESSMVESFGYKVKIAEGLRENVKITTPEDLKYLKKI